VLTTAMTKRTMLRGMAALAAAMVFDRPLLAWGAMPTVEEVLYDKDVPVLGNPQGDVSIVEYFDYQCPYCKRAYPDVTRVVEEDGNVRLIMKDWPIFGDASIYAARLALAARYQGKYADAHHVLMTTDGKLTQTRIEQVLSGHEIDLARARQDAEKEEINGILRRNEMQARAFRLRGTPAFIIGTVIFPGAIDADSMKRAIDQARAEN